MTQTKDGSTRLAPRHGRRRIAVHVHRYRPAGVDWFGNGSLYGCSCGVVRPAP